MFYDVLKKECEAKNITMTKLLNNIDKSTGYINKWKNGKEPNGTILKLIADELNCSADYLLERTNNPKIADPL